RLERDDDFTKNDIKYGHTYKIVHTHLTISFSFSKESNIDAAVSVEILSNNRIYPINISLSNRNASSTTTFQGKIEVFGYGANRFMTSTSLTDSRSENSATLFDDDAKLINAEEWLLQLDYSASKQSAVQE